MRIGSRRGHRVDGEGAWSVAASNRDTPTPTHKHLPRHPHTEPLRTMSLDGKGRRGSDRRGAKEREGRRRS